MIGHVLHVLSRLEKLTRPQRRTGGFDEDAAGEILAVSPDGYYGYAEPNLGIVAVPGQHTPSDRLCVYTAPDGVDSQAICGVCRPVRDIVEQMIEERFPTDPSPTIASAAPQCAVDDEGSSDACGIPPSPSEGRPTSELLIDGANAIECWLEGVSAPAVALAHWRVAADEMRERSATFTDIEQDK